MNKNIRLRINILNASPIYAILMTCMFNIYKNENCLELYIISLKVKDVNICDNLFVAYTSLGLIHVK